MSKFSWRYLTNYLHKLNTHYQHGGFNARFVVTTEARPKRKCTHTKRCTNVKKIEDFWINTSRGHSTVTSTVEFWRITRIRYTEWCWLRTRSDGHSRLAWATMAPKCPKKIMYLNKKLYKCIFRRLLCNRYLILWRFSVHKLYNLYTSEFRIIPFVFHMNSITNQ